MNIFCFVLFLWYGWLGMIILNIVFKKNRNTFVFLGGSCNPTTWRKNIAIPMLVNSNIKYFNPQVENWSEDCIELENTAKENATQFLFVIDSETRSLSSMIESAELLIKNPSSFVLVIQNIIDNTQLDGQTVTGRELKDLNRAREYLKNIAVRHKIKVFRTVEDGVKEIVKKHKNNCNYYV
jgi:hypothetical protein